MPNKINEGLVITADQGDRMPKTRLMEANRKIFEKIQARATKNIEQTAAQCGIKDWKTILNMNEADFSIHKFREGAYKVANKLREAQAELVWGQLLRAGVQNTFNDIYMATPVVYPALVRETSSNKRQEFYAPVERTGFPKRVERQEPFPETTFKGLDIELVNFKTGMLIAFERELLDDDQTGQIVQRAQQMGENARIYEEAYVLNRMFNGTGSLDGETLPASVSSTTPFSTTAVVVGGVTGGINATTAARISQSVIQAGWVLAANMTDGSGRPMVVLPSILAVSPIDIFYAETLMNSDMWPSMSSTQSADIGKVGGIMAKNPIKNLAGIVSSRFIPQYGAMLIDAGKGFNFQRRDPSEVVQENPMSGPAFSQEVFRYKQRARWEADFIDPKFFINLNTSFSST